jgi:hypothetical protein
MTDTERPEGAQAEGPFFCFMCQKVLGWREVKAGRCQGHLLTEFACKEFQSENGELKETVQKHKADHAYGRWQRIPLWAKEAWDIATGAS